MNPVRRFDEVPIGALVSYYQDRPMIYRKISDDEIYNVECILDNNKGFFSPYGWVCWKIDEEVVP